MPKSEVSRKKMFRDFSVIKDRYIKSNDLKYLNLALRDMAKNYNISEAEIRFMVFIYDLEFFTIDYASKAYFYSKRKMWQRPIQPLKAKGYIYKPFDRLSGSGTMEEYMFREETKYSYRIRYALSQNGRLMVSKFYRKMAGEEQINVPIDPRAKGGTKL